MKLLTCVFCSALLLGCATGPSSDQQAKLNAYTANLYAQVQAGKMTNLQRARAMAQAFREVHGTSPQIEEFFAYDAYLSSEQDAGRMTPEQVEYLIAKKEAEFSQKARAQSDAAEAEGWRRAFQRRDTTTNCRPDGLGGVRCTTR